MTPSELKASNDQLRNWNADYREQIVGLKIAASEEQGALLKEILELEARLDAILDAPIDQDHNGNDILVRDYHEVREIVLKALEITE
jgi:hypothetical protein